MPHSAFSKEQVDVYKAAIRGELVRDPRITGIELVERLAKQGINLERHYAARLRDKILAERQKYIVTRAPEALRNEYRDLLRETMKRMWDIMINPYEYSHNRIAAAKEMREAFDKYMAVDADVNILKGVFTTPNAGYVISDPRLIAAVDAMIRFNLLPKNAIDANTLAGGPAASDATPAAPKSSG